MTGILRGMDIPAEFVAKRPGRPNVVGVLPGADPAAPSLILNDHLDTYPAGDWSAWTMTGGPPFRPTRHGGRLYARGTSDSDHVVSALATAFEAASRPDRTGRVAPSASRSGSAGN